jgi:hypothetical protein
VSGAPPEPWYAEGLAFQCTACGKCCRNHGEGFAYVFSTRAERQALAGRLGVSLAEFERQWCERIDGQLSFKSRGDACTFLDGRGRCTVYDLRPRQCRTFPFWPELLVDRDTWERDVASFCPGAGQGKVHDLAAIRTTMKRAGP